MNRKNADFLSGYADLTGSGPTGSKCSDCIHFLDHYSYKSGRLKRLDFLGASEGAILTRNGDIRAVFAARAALDPIMRVSKACCEFMARKCRAA